MDSESDMRFMYCAACVCYMLDDWSTVDRSKMLEYIRASLVGGGCVCVCGGGGGGARQRCFVVNTWMCFENTFCTAFPIRLITHFAGHCVSMYTFVI